jgi:hypothetical protein
LNPNKLHEEVSNKTFREFGFESVSYEESEYVKSSKKVSGPESMVPSVAVAKCLDKVVRPEHHTPAY